MENRFFIFLILLLLASFLPNRALSQDFQSGTTSFSGNISVTSEPEVNLPVYINGKFVGSTPFLSENMPVGKYVVTFLSKPFRDSILRGKFRGDRKIPEKMTEIFSAKLVQRDQLLAKLIENGDFPILVRNGETSEVIYSVTDIRKSITSRRNSMIAGVSIGALLMGGVITMMSIIAN